MTPLSKSARLTVWQDWNVRTAAPVVSAMASATFRLLSSMVYTTGMCSSFTRSMRYFSVASDGSVSPAQP